MALAIDHDLLKPELATIAPLSVVPPRNCFVLVLISLALGFRDCASQCAGRWLRDWRFRRACSTSDCIAFKLPRWRGEATHTTDSKDDIFPQVTGERKETKEKELISQTPADQNAA